MNKYDIIEGMLPVPTPTDFVKQIPMMGYLDPGSGYVFQSSFSTIIQFLFPFLIPLFFFFRKKILPLLKNRIVILVLVTGVILLGFGFYMKLERKNSNVQKKVIVLGFDGMDPRIVEQASKFKLLPNLDKLKSQGAFSPLQTVMPPQSPVAWASFITGTSPAKHGVFDFLSRDTKTYGLDLSFSKKGYLLNGVPFWSDLGRNNIPSTVLFLPDTFPASKLNGRMLSGMGTPDILGTQGTFTLFTSKSIAKNNDWRGRIVSIQNSTDIKAEIPGPKYNFLGKTKISTIPIDIKVNKKMRSAQLIVQGQKIQLKEKVFSSWVPFQFSIDIFTRIRGIGKFYLKSVSPDIELYLNPINIDPRSPIEPISFPKDFSDSVARKQGYFSTLGLPLDTWAFEENVLSEEAFLQQAENIQEERIKIYKRELESFNQGVLIAYFGATDIVQHMFWRNADPLDEPNNSVILNWYAKMDRIVGETLKYLDKDTTLIVLSDHGFGPFDYEIHMNSWLKENGYLFLEKDIKTGKELLSNIDWSKTLAYAIGYNGIYINMEGRELHGIVPEKKAGALAKEISEKLLEYTNPLNNKKVFKKIYSRADLGISPDSVNSPDLFLGFFPGIRSSWDTAVGATPETTVTKRADKWAGDHFFDISEVPGIIFSNVKLASGPGIIDIAPTILDIFGLEKPRSMDGNSLLIQK